MKTRLIITSRNYRIDMTQIEWDALEKKQDDDMNDPNGKLFEDMEKETSCNNIDWNGHFGRSIFFTAAKPEDAKKMVVFIETLVLFLNEGTIHRPDNQALKEGLTL